LNANVTSLDEVGIEYALNEAFKELALKMVPRRRRVSNCPTGLLCGL